MSASSGSWDDTSSPPANPLADRPPLPSTRDLPRLPWLEGEQRQLGRDLSELGCDVTLTSDALQLAGCPRLSQSDPLERRAVLCWMEENEGARAYAEAKARRELVRAALKPYGNLPIRTVARERYREQRAIGVWPLWMLQAIYAKLRAEEIRAERPYHVQLREQWAEVPGPVPAFRVRGHQEGA